MSSSMSLTTDDADMQQRSYDLEKEVDLIHRTAEKQLASVNGLNASLVKKIRKAEAQTSAILTLNRTLEQKNADLVDQLTRCQDDNRSLHLAQSELADVEKAHAVTKTNLINSEVAVKTLQANVDALTNERDTLASQTATADTRIADLSQQLEALRESVEQERSTVKQRDLDFQTATKERDEKVCHNDELQAQITALNAAATQRDEEHRKVIDEKKLIADEADRNRQSAEDRVEEIKYELDTMTKQYDAVKQEKTQLSEDKQRVDKSVAELQNEYDTVAAKHADMQAEYESVKEERDSKAAELVALSASLAKVEQRNGEVEKELDAKNLQFNSIESERNLLNNEKATLENDYKEMRQRCNQMSDDKSVLEKRVIELESQQNRMSEESKALEKQLADAVALNDTHVATIKTLKQEKLKLIDQHEKALSSRFNEIQHGYDMEREAVKRDLEGLDMSLSASAAVTSVQDVEGDTAEDIEQCRGMEREVDSVVPAPMAFEAIGLDDETSSTSRAMPIDKAGQAAPMMQEAMEFEAVDEATVDEFALGGKGEIEIEMHAADDDEEGEGVRGMRAVSSFTDDQEVDEEVVAEGATGEQVMVEEMVEDVDEYDMEKEKEKDEAVEKMEEEMKKSASGVVVDRNEDGIMSEEVVMEEAIVDEDVGPLHVEGQDNVVEEVGEEEAISAEEAAEKKKALESGQKKVSPVDRMTDTTKDGLNKAPGSGRRSGSALLNRMICCVKVDEE